MLLTEKEVRRIVSIHFKEKYEMEVNPDEMNWHQENDMPIHVPITGLNVEGGDCDWKKRYE